MPATKQQLINRELAIKALNDFKSTHTLKEIAAKTSIPLSRLEHYLYKYKHKLNLPLNAFKLRVEEEVKFEAIKLIKQGLTIKEAAKLAGVSYATAQRATKNLELKRCANKYEMALFHQYRRANFEVTPLFLIRTHNITQATAARICNKLKENNA